MNRKHFVVAALFAAVVGSANAGLVTAPAPEFGPDDGADLVTFDEFSGAGTTHIVSQTLTSVDGRQVLFASTPTASIGEVTSQDRGYYDLGANGVWSAGKRFVGTDNPGTLQFTLPYDVAQIGAFFNYRVAEAQPPRGFTITALDAGGLTIESYVIAFNTSGGVNQGAYYGILSMNEDIRGFVVTDGYVALDDLQFVSSIPEASTLALMLVALGAVGWAALRRGAR